MKLSRTISLIAILSTIYLAPMFSPALSQFSPSETRIVVIITGLPEGKEVRVYINGSESGTASIASPIIYALPRGSIITLTADIYVEGSWGYRYELIGVRAFKEGFQGSTSPETQPSIELDSDLVIIMCEYSSYHILLSPLFVPLYALLILIGILSIVRWLSRLMQPLPRERSQTNKEGQNL
ncbi:MAG: hypothetical protein ACUVTL_06805 [Thermoproteota archaeon]